MFANHIKFVSYLYIKIIEWKRMNKSVELEIWFVLIRIID